MIVSEFNSLVTAAMKKRGFIERNGGEQVEKLEGHYYYEPEPLATGRSEIHNYPELKVRLSVYHKEQDVFIRYGAKYTFVPRMNEFVESHAFSYEYLSILKLIRSILEELDILDRLKKDLSSLE